MSSDPVLQSFRESTGRVLAGEGLRPIDMDHAIDAMMRNLCPPGEVAVFLTALKEKGETIDELAGAAMAMRRHMSRLMHDLPVVVDTCGPGGHYSGTFNISTTAAIVAAAAGVPVAKHGNRSITSKTGSADVLESLGVKIDCDIQTASKCLEECGVCFLFAPLMHPSMKHVSPIRKQLGFPTIFNLLGPLCNPASAPFQLLGVGRPELRPLMAGALALLGSKRSFVVYGEDGIGEVSLESGSIVTEVTENGQNEFRWRPEDFGLAPAGRDSMRVNSPAESAAIVTKVVEGESGPPRDIVVINAAATLVLTSFEPDPKTAARRASEAIDSGRAKQTLKRWIDVSNGR